MTQSRSQPPHSQVRRQTEQPMGFPCKAGQVEIWDHREEPEPWSLAHPSLHHTWGWLWKWEVTVVAGWRLTPKPGNTQGSSSPLVPPSSLRLLDIPPPVTAMAHTASRMSRTSDPTEVGIWSEQSPSLLLTTLDPKGVGWGGEEGTRGSAELPVNQTFSDPEIVQNGSTFFLQTECFSKCPCELWEIQSPCVPRTNNDQKRHFLKFPKTTLSFFSWVKVTNACNSLTSQSADQQKVLCLGRTRPTCAFQTLWPTLLGSEEEVGGGQRRDKQSRSI